MRGRSALQSPWDPAGDGGAVLCSCDGSIHSQGVPEWPVREATQGRGRPPCSVSFSCSASEATEATPAVTPSGQMWRLRTSERVGSHPGVLPSDRLEEAQAFEPLLKRGWVCGCNQQPPPQDVTATVSTSCPCSLLSVGRGEAGGLFHRVTWHSRTTGASPSGYHGEGGRTRQASHWLVCVSAWKGHGTSPH